jgi:hypothetical protein
MDRVIARIVIDSEEWEHSFSTAEELSTLTWRRVLSSTAFPFRAAEVNYGIGLVGDQYYL